MKFNEIRKPFYLDPDTLIVKFPASKHMNCSHAEWFTDLGYPYMHTIRGYYWKCEEEYIENDEFIMLYNNNYSIPNLSINVFTYLFEYFPTIKWIGVGCHKGRVGEIWKPQIKVYNGNL